MMWSLIYNFISEVKTRVCEHLNTTRCCAVVSINWRRIVSLDLQKWIECLSSVAYVCLQRRMLSSYSGNKRGGLHLEIHWIGCKIIIISRRCKFWSTFILGIHSLAHNRMIVCEVSVHYPFFPCSAYHSSCLLFLAASSWHS